MGVTIHFEGRLKDKARFDALVRAADSFARVHDWPVRPIAAAVRRLVRVRGDQDSDYTGPTSGIEILPHPQCDPVRLEFDADWFVQDYIKTQFAGPNVHRTVIELLRELAPHFDELSVEDEGEYWETGDESILAKHIDACNRALADELAKRPGARGPVQFASGRWIDLVS